MDADLMPQSLTDVLVDMPEGTDVDGSSDEVLSEEVPDVLNLTDCVFTDV